MGREFEGRKGCRTTLIIQAMKKKLKQSINTAKNRELKKHFLQFFSEENLCKIFEKKISNKDNAGIDGIHAHDLKCI